MLTLTFIILKKDTRLVCNGKQRLQKGIGGKWRIPAEASASSELITGAVSPNWHSAAQLKQGCLDYFRMQGNIKTARKVI